MSSINKFFELIRCTKSWWNTKKVRAVITKRSVVGMLDDAHELYNSITHLFYLWKNILSEISKGMNFFLTSRHSDMALVYADAFVFPLWFRIFPFILALLDINSIKGTIWILTGKIDPSRNPILFFPIGKLYFDLDCRVFLDVDWHFTSPVPKIILVIGRSYLFAKVLTPLPLIELPEDWYAPCLRGPLSVHKLIPLLVKTVLLVALG